VKKWNEKKKRERERERKKDEITKRGYYFLSLKHDCRQGPNQQTLMACRKQNIPCEFVCI
jgi:hypothetical protein